MAFARWRASPGKRGPLARAVAVHARADAHAMANPRIRLRTPRTLAESSRMLGQMARDLEQALTLRIRQAFDAGIPSGTKAQAMRNDLRALADEWLEVARPNVRDAVEAAFSLGKIMSKIALGGEQEGGVALSFSKPDRYAMQAVFNDTFADLAGQTRNMVTGAVEILRTAGGSLIREAVVKGTNPRTLARQIEAELVAKGFAPGEALREYVAARNRQRHPVTGVLPARKVHTWRDAVAQQAEFGELRFIDRAGRQWDLGAYSRMVARTKLAIASTEGAILSMSESGVHHYTVSDHGTATEVCKAFEGETFWTGEGDSLGYDQASTLPPYHPNCWHYVYPAVLVEPK